MITTFLATLWASKLFRQGLAILVAFVAMWGIVHTYNSWVIEDAIDQNDKEWTVKLDAEVDKFDKYKKEQLALSEEKIKKEKDRAEKAEKDYHLAVQEIAKVSAKRDSYGKSRDDLERVLNSISAGGPCDTTNNQCRFVTELRRGYASCERDLTTAIGIAGQTNDRARKAELGIKALTTK